MATFQITGVRTEQSSSGYHEHISHVQIGGSSILRRQTVVDDIRTPGGDRYHTEAGGQRADVVVVRCPNCTFNESPENGPRQDDEEQPLGLAAGLTDATPTTRHR